MKSCRPDYVFLATMLLAVSACSSGGAGTGASGGSGAGGTTKYGGASVGGATTSITGGVIISGGVGAGGTSGSGGSTSKSGMAGTSATGGAGGTPGTGGAGETGGLGTAGGVTGSGGASIRGGNADGGTARGGSEDAGTAPAGSVTGGSPTDGASGLMGTPDSGGSSSSGYSSSSTTTTPGNGCTPPAAYANLFISLLGQTQAASDAKIEAAWNQLFNPSNANTIFYNGPGAGEAYVEDVADNAVRSEGQSYGMMIAVQLNHQTEFDELWTFVLNHMWTGNSDTISWQTSTSGSVTGSGGAPDGDEWFAAALLFAHNRWGDTSGKYNYGTEAQKTLDLVRTTDFSSTYNLVRYYTGTDSNGTDASYMLPAYYQTWACFDTANADFWNTALTTTRAWLQTAAGTTGNIGDQSSFAGQTTNSSGDDKLRIVANFMSDYNFFHADPFEATYASEYATWVSSNNNGSTAMLACNSLLGFGLPASSGKAWVQALWSAAIPTGTYRYYDGALYTIALLHVSGAFHLWY
jgi:oligosaccharide reducing-end xylanase